MYVFICMFLNSSLACVVALQKARGRIASSREKTGALRNSSGEISSSMKQTVFYLMTSSRSSVRYMLDFLLFSPPPTHTPHRFNSNAVLVCCISVTFCPSGQRGAGLRQHIWSEHYEHGEGA